MFRYLMEFIVETDDPTDWDGQVLEGDREITAFLEEQGKHEGDFLKLTIKKLLN